VSRGGLDVNKGSAISSLGRTEMRRFKASAIAASVAKVGFFCCCENSRRTAAGGMLARLATSALVNPSSCRLASRDRTTSSKMVIRRVAAR
jgi:hypothetical protein